PLGVAQGWENRCSFGATRQVVTWNKSKIKIRCENTQVLRSPAGGYRMGEDRYPQRSCTDLINRTRTLLYGQVGNLSYGEVPAPSSGVFVSSLFYSP
ncbi:MAG: hypothetical protein JXB10_17185, partial [Pirellulales bacterium]|nr:hypothetical protein [Pirellulales bacterium]